MRLFPKIYIIIHRAPEKIIEVEIPRLNLQIVQEWSTPPYKKMTEILDENKERNNCFYFFLKKGFICYIYEYISDNNTSADVFKL